MDKRGGSRQDSRMASSEREYQKACRVLGALKAVKTPDHPYITGRMPELEEALAAAAAVRAAIDRRERELVALRARRVTADKKAWKIGGAIISVVQVTRNATQPLLLKLMGLIPKAEQARRGPKRKLGKLKPPTRRR